MAQPRTRRDQVSTELVNSVDNLRASLPGIMRRLESLERRVSQIATVPSSAAAGSSLQTRPSTVQDHFHKMGGSCASLEKSHGTRDSTPLGQFRLDSATVARLFHSFCTNVRMPYPFLDEETLQAYKADFNRQYFRQQCAPAESSPMNSFVEPSHSSNISTPKLECGCHQMIISVEHTIYSAIVLLVLALGQIWERTEPIASMENLQDNTTALTQKNAFDTIPHSTPEPSNASEIVAERRRAQQPVHNSPLGHKPFTNSMRSAPTEESLHTVPGIAYYVHARQILGSLSSANRLPHIQAFLLAALYETELSHPAMSWDWLQRAGKTCSLFMDRYDLLIAKVHYWSIF